MLSFLSAGERQRYDRQIGPGVLSAEGQRRLKSSAALVTRVGGVGGPAALALAMAGIGKLVIAHGGLLETPDLNRQLLGSEDGVDRPRAEQFAAGIRRLSRFVKIEVIDHEPSDREAADLARRVQIILSCAADFEHRLRLSRAAHRACVPFLDAAQWGMAGSLVVSDGTSTPCLDCVYPEEPPFETHFPVIGAISAAMGNLAALEAIKILSGVGRPTFGQMLVVDGFGGDMRWITLRRRSSCPFCSVYPPATGEKIKSSSFSLSALTR
jgi:molybdopterin-synthase adenylyltransferase